MKISDDSILKTIFFPLSEKIDSLQRFLVPLFTFIYWNRLKHDNPLAVMMWHRGHIVKVKGWRTVLVDTPGRGRSIIVFMFWWNKPL